MKVGITAATGSLGRCVTQECLALTSSENVVAIARSPERLADLPCEVRKGDFEQPDSLRDAFSGLDAILLIPTRSAPAPRMQEHRNVVQAALDASVQRMVFAGILLKEAGDGFNAIQKVTRQTEKLIQESGFGFSFGRNGIYIEPDFEYIPEYEKLGKIVNCAGDGLCAYTSRNELGMAYAHLLTNSELDGRPYNLVGQGITQHDLAQLMNRNFGTSLTYEAVSEAAYTEERTKELGPFMGPIIAGIYAGISKGAFNAPSDFEPIVGRPHLSPDQMAAAYQASF